MRTRRSVPSGEVSATKWRLSVFEEGVGGWKFVVGERWDKPEVVLVDESMTCVYSDVPLLTFSDQQEVVLVNESMKMVPGVRGWGLPSSVPFLDTLRALHPNHLS